MSCMETYVDKNGRELPGYFDYKSFVDELFVAWWMKMTTIRNLNGGLGNHTLSQKLNNLTQKHDKSM